MDGFETFEFSQYYPFHFNVAVEPKSQFFLYFTESELRRKGRMTSAQRLRRGVLEAARGRADPKSVERGVRDLLEFTLRGCQSAIVMSDQHPAYRRAIGRLRHRIQHVRTSSKVARNHRNPLWPVNLLDLLIRHSQSNHKRETIAFSKRRQGAIDRLMVLLVWRNYIKSQRERTPGVTPSMIRGTTDRAYRVEDVLSRRLFPNRTKLSDVWQKFYRRRVPTRAIEVNREHCLDYAF